MGRLHARVYGEMPNVELVSVCDADGDNARRVAETYGGRHTTDVTDLIGNVKAVTIAVPTIHHLEVAKPLLEAGIACLIEKPLAQDTATAREIAELAAKHDAVVQVGHIERFNPVVRSLRSLSITPRFIEVTRVSPMTFRSVDVGVVLDMMIHDIDIVTWLAGSTVEGVEAVGVPVLVPGVEDVCNARIRYANGCVANLTASRMALKTERKLRVFSPEAYVSLDYHKKAGVFIRKGDNVEKMRQLVEQLRSGEVRDLGDIDYEELVNVEQLTIDDTEPLRAQADSFIAAATGEQKPEISAEDGMRAVETAEKIVAAIPEVSV